MSVHNEDNKLHVKQNGPAQSFGEEQPQESTFAFIPNGPAAPFLHETGNNGEQRRRPAGVNLHLSETVTDANSCSVGEAKLLYSVAGLYFSSLMVCDVAIIYCKRRSSCTSLQKKKKKQSAAQRCPWY